MRQIRLAALAAAAAVVFAFVLSPAAEAARSCDNGEAGCVPSAQQAAPMKLDDFMKTWKPASASKAAKKSKKGAKPAPPVEAADEPAVTETETAPASETVSEVAAGRQHAVETDGVAVTSFDEVNEIDAAADQVEVVAFNEVNAIDLAAPLADLPETTGQSVSTTPPPANNSWLGKLLLAVAGTIAVAGATRLLLA